MRGGLSALALMALPALATAQEPVAWDCLTDDGRAFRVELWQPSGPSGPVHCVAGLDLGGVGSCAPQGGWGLSDPEAAPGEVAALTDDPREARGAEGRFFARVGPSEFVASASRGAGMPLALEVHGPTFWRIRMELLTGEGALFTREGRVGMRCGSVEAGP